MRSSLDSLIKLYSFQLDDKRRKLADIRELAAQITISLQTLEATLAAEAAIAAKDSSNYGQSYAVFRETAEKRRQTLLESIARLEDEIAHINEEILLSFQELKRYETANAERGAQKKKKLQAKEQYFADEIAVQRQGIRG